MKGWALGPLLFGAGLFCLNRAPATEITVIVGGDTKGYLSPCGCTKPMVGGIRRRAAAIRALQASSKNVVTIENGGLAGGTSRQSELKAESMAESLKEVHVDAINLTSDDAALGQGEIASIQRLSGGKLITGSAEGQGPVELQPFVESGGCLIGGASTNASLGKPLDMQTVSAAKAAKSLALAAAARHLVPVLMVDGNERDARVLAESSRSLRLIVYRNQGDPPRAAVRIGQTWLVTPGEQGKHVIVCRMKGDELAYQVIDLGPDVSDDPAVAQTYDAYLGRVEDEKLLDQWPRIHTEAYAGSKACLSCHVQAAKAWTASAHYHALASIEQQHHGRDPDCVSCHVTGLSSDSGFRSREETPELANVGCESCHGPGKTHAEDPSQLLPGTAKSACLGCHTLENSPGFDFAVFWGKIAH